MNRFFNFLFGKKSEENNEINISNDEQIKNEDSIVETIQKAINSNAKLIIEYISAYSYSGCERTERIIVPISIYTGKELSKIMPLEDGQWVDDEKYLYAFCKLRKEKRTFRIGRISSIKIIN